jgi:haloacetate dehalogenase
MIGLDIDRRRVLSASGAVVSAAIIQKSFAQSATSSAGSLAVGEFEPIEIKTSDNTIFARRYGKGARVLMVHGFPPTSLMWSFVAPKLASDHTLICVDLRGYGRSGAPDSTGNHFPYSKRAMAAELVEVMDNLGFSKFDVVGHDRGGRVSYRLALDHSEKVQRLAVFDVIPISEGWGHADAKFAMTYWPWILLSQKSPLPEKYLLGAPDAVFGNPFGQDSFGEDIKSEYLETYRDRKRVHAVCEEYRAAATIDIEHDKKDVADGKKITCPMLHLFGPKAVRWTRSMQAMVAL